MKRRVRRVAEYTWLCYVARRANVLANDRIHFDGVLVHHVHASTVAELLDMVDHLALSALVDPADDGTEASGGGGVGGTVGVG